jgi:hypothetical protein
MNPNYATRMKHDFDKLLIVGFIQPIEEAKLSSSIVIMPMKNGKLHICIDFHKLNVATKKIPYMLSHLLRI